MSISGENKAMSEEKNKSDYESFSEAKKRLEEIARALEENDVTLEKSMELYEEGAQLVKICYDKLNNAKQKFTLINAVPQESDDEQVFG